MKTGFRYMDQLITVGHTYFFSRQSPEQSWKISLMTLEYIFLFMPSSLLTSSPTIEIAIITQEKKTFQQYPIWSPPLKDLVFSSYLCPTKAHACSPEMSIYPPT